MPLLKKQIWIVALLLLPSFLHAQKLIAHKTIWRADSLRETGMDDFGGDNSIALTVDNKDNIYLVLSEGHGISFAGDTLQGGYQCLKFDSTGNELWGVAGQRFTNVFTDEDNNVYIYGHADSGRTVLFANHRGVNTPVIDTGYQPLDFFLYRSFLLKFDSSGTLQWYKFFSNTFMGTETEVNSSQSQPVGCTDKFGNSYIAFAPYYSDHNISSAFSVNGDSILPAQPNQIGCRILKIRKDGTMTVLPNYLPGLSYIIPGYKNSLDFYAAVSDTITIGSTTFVTPHGTTQTILGSVDTLMNILSYAVTDQTSTPFPKRFEDSLGNLYFNGHYGQLAGIPIVTKYTKNLDNLWSITLANDVCNCAAIQLMPNKDVSSLYLTGIGWAYQFEPLNLPQIYSGFLVKMSPSGRTVDWFLPTGTPYRLGIGNGNRLYEFDGGIQIIADTAAPVFYADLTYHKDPGCSNPNSGMAIAHGFHGTPPYTYQWKTDGFPPISSLVAVTNSDTLSNAPANNTYYCIVYDSAGDSARVDAPLNYPLSLSPPIYVANGLVGYPLCPQTVELKTYQYSNFSFQWYLDNTPIAGANAYLYDAIDSGVYTVEVIDSNGCGSYNSVTIIFYPKAHLNLPNTFFCASDERNDTLTGGSPIAYSTSYIQYTGSGVTTVNQTEGLYVFNPHLGEHENHYIYYTYNYEGCITTDSELVNINICISPPINLIAQIVDTTNIKLQWTDTSTRAGFIIYRSIGSSGFLAIDSVPGSQTLYTDSSLALGTSYRYYVTAMDSVGESDSSNHAGATIAAIPCTATAYFQLYPDTTTPHHWLVLNEASGVSPIYYYWTWGDGTSSSGASPSHTYADSGYYTICLNITDGANCASSYCDTSFLRSAEQLVITLNVVNALPTSIQDLSNDYIAIYPNPTNGLVTVFTPTLTIDNIEINDAIGKDVFRSRDIISNTSVLDLKDLENGIYFISLHSNKGTFVKRLIVTK